MSIWYFSSHPKVRSFYLFRGRSFVVQSTIYCLKIEIYVVFQFCQKTSDQVHIGVMLQINYVIFLVFQNTGVNYKDSLLW